MSNSKNRSSGVILAICLLLTACGGGGGSDVGGGNGSGSGSGGGFGSSNTGTLSLSISDAPIHEAQAVEIDFSGVEVKTENGPAIEFRFCEDLDDAVNNPPIVVQGACSGSAPAIVTIDLLQQTGGASYRLLDGVELPAGRVNWMRLMLTDPAGRIYLSDGEHDLRVPSGNQTGLKLNRGFDVPAGVEVAVNIDFDVRKSIVGANGNYKLKPTLRMVTDYGAIAGEINTSLVPATCLGPSVYVFTGAATSPDDIDGDNGDPITSAMVKADTDSSTGYAYRVDFLAPGLYTAAFICADGELNADGTYRSAADDPEKDDEVRFQLPTFAATATVSKARVVNISF